MSSGAGGGESRRRRDSDMLCLLGSMTSVQFQFSKLSRTLSPLMKLESNSSSSNRGLLCIWYPVNVFPICPLHLLTFSTAQLPFSRSGFAQNPPEDFSHWASLMARDFPLGPSDAPCLVESSTAHGVSIFLVVFSKLSNESSTTKVVNFLTQTLEKSRSAPNDQRLATSEPIPATVSFSDQEILIRSRRNHRQPLGSRKGKTEPAETLSVQTGSSLGLGLTTPGPLKVLSRPMSATWPRSVYSYFLTKPNLTMSLLFVENGRRLQFHKLLTSLVGIDKNHLITLEEDTLSAINCFKLSKKLVLQSSSFIERTSVWFQISLLRNHLRTLLPQGRRLGSDLNSQEQPDYKLCVEFLNLHGQWLHVREDPPALLRLVTHQKRFPVSSSSKAMSTWQPSNPLVSPMEHTFKSSYASIVRAKYDHLLVRDFMKLVFKLGSYKTSKDLSSLASSSRLCIFLEDSCSLYLYIYCNPLFLSCKNIPLLRL